MQTMSYVVIGGQYRYFCHGEYKTLRAAQIAATKNVEYWDNWQGLKTPKIYKIEDTENYYDEFFQCWNRRPAANCVRCWEKINNKWTETYNN